jgi:NitT/TauT family transport system substrate-binding protein
MTKRLLNVVFGLVILAFAFGCGEGEKKTSAPKPLPQVSVQFGWLFDAHHLGFLLAKQRGYYEQEGVSVTLAPGGLDASPTKAVATGTAQIGQISGPEQLIGAGRDGLPIVGIAAFHRKSPHALISLAKKPIRQPGDLRGADRGYQDRS